MRPPLPPPPTPPVQVDLSQSTGIECERCNNATFQEVLLLRRFSALTSPTGVAGKVPIPVLACCACGWVNVEFVPAALRAPAPETTSEKGGIVQSSLEPPTPAKSHLSLI